METARAFKKEFSFILNYMYVYTHVCPNVHRLAGVYRGQGRRIPIEPEEEEVKLLRNEPANQQAGLGLGP